MKHLEQLFNFKLNSSYPFNIVYLIILIVLLDRLFRGRISLSIGKQRVFKLYKTIKSLVGLTLIKL